MSLVSTRDRTNPTGIRGLTLKATVLACLTVAMSYAWATPAASQVMKFGDEKAWWDQHFSQMPDPNYKGSGWRPYQRWVWFYGQRVDEATGYVPQGARWNSYLEQQRMINGPGSGTRTSNVWTNLGPTNIAGRATPIAIDPSNHNRILLGTASGGLWESLNAGVSWEPVDDQLPSLAVGAILFDSSDPNIIYIGTGEGNFSSDAVFGVGVLQSTDGGSTWNIFGSGLDWAIGDGKCVEKLVQNPNNGTIIAATTAGVYRMSAGVWTQTLAGTATGLLYRPDGGTTWYAALGRPNGGSTNGVYISTDDGLTWTEQTNGLPSSGVGRLDICLCTSQPNVMYTGISQPGGTMLGIWKTTDGGATWALAYNSNNHYSGQGWYDLVIAVDPTNPNIVYSAGLDIWVSTNGGTSFTKKTAWNAPVGSPTYVHADHHGWLFHPDDHNHVYDACDGGIFQSFDGGNNWQEITTGLQTMQFYDADVSQTNPNIAAGGAQDNGTNVYTGTGAWDRALGGDGFHANIDYARPDTMYMEVYYGDHYRSYNGGLTLTRINSGIGEQGAWDTPVLIDRSNTAILYTAHRKIYKTTDRGASWAAKSGFLSGIGTELAQSPSDPTVLYAVFVAHSLYKSTDQGETWNAVSGTGLPSRGASRIAVHPTDPATLFLTTTGFSTNNVWKSTDSGATFTSIGGNLPALPCSGIAVDPDNANIIYVGTDLGVWRTEDGGATWSPYGTGLPNVVVADLRIMESQRLLYAGTYGRGLWATPLEGASASVQETTTPGKDLSIVGLFPNPLNIDQATVRFTLPQAGRVKVQLFDASGRLIEAPLDQEMTAGTHRVEWNSAAPNGVYFVRVREGQRISTGKLVIRR